MKYKSIIHSELFKKGIDRIVIIISTTVLVMLCMVAVYGDKGHKESETIYKEVFDSNDPYSEVKLKNYLIQLHVKYPEVAIAQMKLESNNASSNIFNQGNNLFGMKVAVRRPTTAIGSKNNHALYSHWRQSVIDYALWQSFVADPENIYSEEAWINYINKFYSKDDSYKTKLLVIKKNLKK